MEKLSAQLPGSLQFGKDGVSPVVKVEEIADGHRITITDVNGSISFEVPDGKDGKSAYDYAVEAGYTGDSSAFANALVKALTAEAVISVNGISPDENGNVEIDTNIFTQIDLIIADDGTVTAAKSYAEIWGILDGGRIPCLQVSVNGMMFIAYWDSAGYIGYGSEDTAISFSCDNISVNIWPDDTVEYKFRRLFDANDLIQETNGFQTVDYPPSACAVADYVQEQIGDISTALDSIIAMQEELIGG